MSESKSICTAAHQQYRAALALNNSSVTLLEQGDLQDSIDTFKDALAMMKKYMVSAAEDSKALASANASLNCSFVMDEMLSAAASRLARSPKKPPLDVNVRPFDDGDLSLISSLRQGNLVQHGAAFPVRLRCDPANPIFDDQNLDIPSAAMLYNLGVAHSLAVSTTTYAAESRPERRKNHMAAAFQCFSMAHSILSRNIDNCESAFHKLRVMLLAGLVLSQLFQMLRSTSRFTEAEEVLATLGWLLEEMEDCQSTLRAMNIYTTSHHGTAPAA
jgi:hypothetical protein